jgi:DNA-binding NarL/FixJ family response regulator
MPITLVIADDHPLILDAMENLFRLEKDFKVVARCLDGDAALKAARRHKPDILVLDIQMPRHRAATAPTRALPRSVPSIR